MVVVVVVVRSEVTGGWVGYLRCDTDDLVERFTLYSMIVYFKHQGPGQGSCTLADSYGDCEVWVGGQPKPKK